MEVQRLARAEYVECNCHGADYQHDRRHECRPTKRPSVGTLVHGSDGIDAPGDLHPACRRQESSGGGQRQETFNDRHVAGMGRQERSVNDVRSADWSLVIDLRRYFPSSQVELGPFPLFRRVHQLSITGLSRESAAA